MNLCLPFVYFNAGIHSSYDTSTVIAILPNPRNKPELTVSLSPIFRIDIVFVDFLFIKPNNPPVTVKLHFTSVKSTSPEFFIVALTPKPPEIEISIG